MTAPTDTPQTPATFDLVTPDFDPDTALRSIPIAFPPTDPPMFLVQVEEDETPIPNQIPLTPLAVRQVQIPILDPTQSTLQIQPLWEVFAHTGEWVRVSAPFHIAPGYHPDAPEANDPTPYPHPLYRLQSKAVIEQVAAELRADDAKHKND